MCDFNCLECTLPDCDNDSPATDSERKSSLDHDKTLNVERNYAGIDMTRYIHNRPDKAEYERARNREYELKRKGSAARKEAKRRQYLRHREEKIAYQRKYYAEHKEEVLAGCKARYHAKKKLKQEVKEECSST